MSKKANKLTVFYDDLKRKNIYKLNGVDVSDTIELLLEHHEKEIVSTKCKLFQLDMTVQQRLQDQIADLEAKLAESENARKDLIKGEYEKCCKDCCAFDEQVAIAKDYYNECEQLKQQLADREEEIKQLNNRILFSQLQAPEEQRLKIIGSSCCQHNPNQDKISFCIEKLEHLRNIIDNETYYCYGDNNINIVINKNKFNEEIDNQIKQLKEGK